MKAPVETISLKGRWWDVIETKSGEKTITPVRNNLVVTTGKVLMAALLKNDPTIGVGKGILFHCIGEGDPAWDTGGVPAPTVGQTTLTDEIAAGGRVVPTEIVYLDGAGGSPTLTPTAFIRVKTVFDYGDLDPGGVDIREQGLFGGDATAIKDSGYMIDVINHNRIFKDSNVRLTRYIEFEF